MKKILILIAFFGFFLIGLKSSDVGTSTSKLLEQEKQKYEEQIQTPGNNYEPKQLVPEENIVNKTAHGLDNILDKMMNGLKKVIIVLLIKEKTNKANIIIILLFIPSPKYFMMYIH